MEKVVVLDPGHGGKSSGAMANGLKEKNINLTVALKAKEFLKKYKVRVELTRETDIFVSLEDRAKIVKSLNPVLCWSVHHNAFDGTVRGAEIIDAHYNKNDDALSLDWLERMKVIGMPIRRRFSRIDKNGKDWYFMVREIITDTTEAVISEGGFIDNVEDAALLKQSEFLEKQAKAIAQSIAKYLNLQEIKEDESKLTPIMGNNTAMAQQMASLVLRVNKEPKLPNTTVLELAQIFLEEGEKEGVRGDIAWAQSILETGYFRYGGVVLPEQNNYAGIGATGESKPATFESPRIGVRAQMQHLKAYASTLSLNQPNVDPRFDLVKRGSAPYVEWLGYADNPNGVGWAYPGDGYGEKILNIYSNILNEQITEITIPRYELEQIVNLLNQLSQGSYNYSEQIQKSISEVISKINALL